MLRPASSQALMQRRHDSAQIRQCSCILACFSHSSPQSRQAAAQVSNILRIISSSEPVRRVDIRRVMSQMSAQSQVQPDALGERLHVVFGEASVGAGRAGLGAGVALLDAADERIVGLAADLRVGTDHLLRVH